MFIFLSPLHPEGRCVTFLHHMTLFIPERVCSVCTWACVSVGISVQREREGGRGHRGRCVLQNRLLSHGGKSAVQVSLDPKACEPRSRWCKSQSSGKGAWLSQPRQSAEIAVLLPSFLFHSGPPQTGPCPRTLGRAIRATQLTPLNTHLLQEHLRHPEITFGHFNPGPSPADIHMQLATTACVQDRTPGHTLTCCCHLALS